MVVYAYYCFTGKQKMTNLKQLLAFNLKHYRLKLGLTQAKLAEKAEVSTQYMP
jgi:DNA-binding XRE family transcriptional regulator